MLPFHCHFHNRAYVDSSSAIIFIKDYGSAIAMAESQIEITVENYVAVITMNNPPVNAQGQRFHEDMMSAMD